MNQYIIIIRSIIIRTTTIYQIHSRLPALSGGGLYHLWEYWSGCRKWAFVDNSINWKRTHFHLAKKRISFIDQYVPEKEKGVFKILKLKSILTGELKHQIAAKKVSGSEGVVLIMMSICLSLCNVLVYLVWFSCFFPIMIKVCHQVEFLARHPGVEPQELEKLIDGILFRFLSSIIFCEKKDLCAINMF